METQQGQATSPLDHVEEPYSEPRSDCAPDHEATQPLQNRAMLEHACLEPNSRLIPSAKGRGASVFCCVPC